MKKITNGQSRFSMIRFVVGAPVLLLLAALLISGCGHKQQAQGFGGTPEVAVETVKAETVPVTTELPGRLDAVRVAQVRARATGIVLKRLFEEGSDVKEGEEMFQIDPAPLQAALDSAKASLARAEANLAQTQAKAERYQALVKINAVSKQDYDDANAAALQAKADVQAAKATVETASLNLGYASVTAPISGRIGAAMVTEGALVSQSAATEMAVIQQLDPIYFDFTESSTEALQLRREMQNGKLKSVTSGETKITLLLEDGTSYAHPGKLLFSDISVDPSSGMITLRAEFPNPDHLLLPGMFARGRLEEAVDNQALTVPQRAVKFGPGGGATVMVVDAENKVEERAVQADTAFGNKWIISRGLKAGERVVVDGLQKVQPGVAVKPVVAEKVEENSTSSSAGK